MLIVVLPFWVWLALLPITFTIRASLLVLRLSLATMRVIWRISRAAASKSSADCVS